MADIELVIKIDEEQYEFIKQNMTMDKVKEYPALLYDICEHIKIGTPLPKGHDRLIDVKQIVTEDECIWNSDGSCTTITTYDIDSTPTIIETDKKGDIYAD